MAALCDRLSRLVVQQLCGIACSRALRGPQRLPFLMSFRFTKDLRGRFIKELRGRPQTL
jgi:hypothetical protein